MSVLVIAGEDGESAIEGRDRVNSWVSASSERKAECQWQVVQLLVILKDDLEVLLRQIALHSRRNLAARKQQSVVEDPLRDKFSREIGVFGRKSDKSVKRLERLPEILLVLLDCEYESEGVAAFQFLLRKQSEV